MEREIEWPITDVVVTENLIGSLTQAVSLNTSSALSFPSPARVSDNIISRRRNPHGFDTLCRRVAVLGNRIST